MVRDKVHHELEFSFLETLFQADEIGLRPEVSMQSTPRHRERSAADVSLGKTGKRRPRIPAAIRGELQRHLTARRASLPRAQEPDIVEAHGRHLVEKGVGDIGQGSRTPQVIGKLPEPDSGVY